jgi:putative zinc finger/helix-turn-helix YgiT family protein
MKKCNRCKAETVEAVEIEEQFVFGDFTVTVRGLPASRCNSCGSQVIAGLALKEAEEAAAQQLARTSIVTGETFRFMRKVLGLPAKEVAEIFGVSPETVSRWERGERDVDRAAWIVIAETMRLPTGERAEALERLRGLPRRPGKQTFIVEAVS